MHRGRALFLDRTGRLPVRGWADPLDHLVGRARVCHWRECRPAGRIVDLVGRPARAAEETEDAMHPDARTRSAVEQHWRASDAGDDEAEHAIYAVDAVLDYPQSGERFRGRATISAQRGGHPASRHFTVVRIVGGAGLWVSECIITYDSVPTYSISIMEFADHQVVHETQYFADNFAAPAWRAALAEPMPGRTIAPA
jgi:hypothetical protein